MAECPALPLNHRQRCAASFSHRQPLPTGEQEEEDEEEDEEEEDEEEEDEEEEDEEEEEITLQWRL